MLLNQIRLPNGSLQFKLCNNDTSNPIITLDKCKEITKLCNKTLADIFAQGYIIIYKNKKACITNANQ